MKSVERHLADCRSLVTASPPVRVPTADAIGMRTAERVLALAPYPAFVASAMDGYAVRLADVPGRLHVVGDVAAGAPPGGDLRPGTAARVMTGAGVPPGTEAVVPVEEVTVDGDYIELVAATTAGRHIRGIGEDVQPGDVILQPLQRVGAAQLAALVAHNVEDVLVHRRAKVAVLSTGDELVTFGQTAGPFQLVDSNGPALAAAASAAGADVVACRHVGDDIAQFLVAVDELPPVDLLVTSGGVSMGAYDVVKAALRERGVRFESVAMQPGKPQAWGRIDAGPAFLGLPGNPVSALISFEIFGRAALGAERTTAAAVLVDDLSHSPQGKRQYLRGFLADGEVRIVGGAQSHLVVGLANANCLIVVEESATQLRAGTLVPVILLDC